MFTRIFLLALAIHGSVAAPSGSEPLLDALQNYHNLVLQDKSYQAAESQIHEALGSKVSLLNDPIHYQSGYVATLSQPKGTGQILGQHSETFALGQQKAQASKVVSHPVETRMLTQAVQVPVQTMQTVQVPTIQYQTVQAPVQVQKEIVQVEKPVPVPHPVPVESPPKPYIKEAIYARPFSKSQQIIKTRIQPLEVYELSTHGPETTTRANIGSTTTQTIRDTSVDYTEENLFFANRKRKIVTRFIKVEEIYEAETTEKVGVFYNYGPSKAGDFELQITRIFEVDQPILVKNETTTTKTTRFSSPTHIIKEYVNGVAVHFYHAGNPRLIVDNRDASSEHYQQFHSGKFGQFASVKSNDPFSVTKRTEFLNGKQVEIEETTYVLPGGRALLVEKRVRAAGDISPFSANIEPFPSFSSTIQNGQKVFVFTMTYDSTNSLPREKYGVSVSESFGTDFNSFMKEFEQIIPSTVYNRMKRAIDSVEGSARKKRSVVDAAPAIELPKEKRETAPVSATLKEKRQSAPIAVTPKEKRELQRQIEHHNKIYTLSAKRGGDDIHPEFAIYKSRDGEKIKVEEEVITNVQGAPRNEYLRYSQIYVPRRQVKYEVSGLYNPAESYFGGNFGSFHGNLPFYPLNNLYSSDSISYKYGSPQFNNPFQSFQRFNL